MAQRRMFSLDIVASDAFLEMPISTQCLYYHLGMYADDDGFVSPKKIVRMIGGSEDDIKILLGKRFLLPFESGVVVVKHWKINNYIQKDRYKETKYLEEKNSLNTKENGSYTEIVQNVYKSDTQVSIELGKDSKGKVSLVGVEEKTTDLTVALHTKKNKSFFENEEEQQKIIDWLIGLNIPAELARKEIMKFISYWTEPNASGTKQRWQMEKTFEIQRRLHNWLSKVKDFNKTSNGKERKWL